MRNTGKLHFGLYVSFKVNTIFIHLIFNEKLSFLTIFSFVPFKVSYM